MAEDILITTRPPISVIDFTREEIVSWLESALSGRGVERAFLFGSVAENSAGSWSDIDLMIVKHSNTPFIERPREFWDLHDRGLAMDILVYTPDEFTVMEAENNSFWKAARRCRIELSIR